ncbi:MAG: hypothetical protein AVDCRST_MAG50-887 [uncultured Acidimicrobiales bacterium]|uniref:Uncharacterized protein n=1 Tax=uncultured Acidimicrobiales bacterium TaxID=310071 RepID=A0A6J4H248_9ACTN|nr:MAG: hypothetical protein AVDCRST_MAG50-887 [uncultured Acidimicrobiales bacterium]
MAGALLRARALARVAIVVFAGAAVLVGLTVGFGVLQDATASVR